MSVFDSRCSVLFSLLLFVFSSRLQVSACFMMQIDDVCNACPTHHQYFPNFLFSWKMVCPLPQVIADGVWPIDFKYLVWTIVHKYVYIFDYGCSSSSRFSSVQYSRPIKKRSTTYYNVN